MAVLAATVFIVPGASADSHPGQTAVGLNLRGNIVDTETSSETYLRHVNQVDVYEDNGKRFALTWARDEGLHVVDITDVDSIGGLPQSDTDTRAHALASAGAVASWKANDGNRYFIAAWESSDTLQLFTLHSDGRIWARWASGGTQLKYVTDSSTVGAPTDVFVYTLQDGVCQTSSGCEVFTGVTVNQGEPIYKNYALVATEGALYIYEVTDPNDFCACNSGAGQKAQLRGGIVDSAALNLAGHAGTEYYQQNGRHYVLVASNVDDGIQVVDITDPTAPVARGRLTDTSALALNGAFAADVYTVNGRLYAVVTADEDDGIQIVDITDPTAPTPVAQLLDTSSLRLDNPQGVTVHTIGDRHYAVAASLFEDGIQVIDITDPSNPVAKSNIGHASGRLLDGAHDVTTFEESGRHYAIVAAESSHGLQIVELTAVTADAGPDTDIPKTATQVTLDGTGSTVSSGATPTYAWTQIAGATVTLSGATTAQPTFVPPAAGGTLTFRLTVTAAGVSATDTVTLTVETSAKNVDSHGAKIGGTAVNTEQVQKPDGGAATYISMHFSGENETQSIAYSLLAQPTGTATVNVMSLVMSAGYGAPGYTWDWNAVSVSPKTLTFTASNWSDPQTINITSNPDADFTPEQVFIVFKTSALSKYTGIHITVDDPGQGSSGTEGQLGILKRPEEPEVQELQEEQKESQPQQEGQQGGIAEPEADVGEGTESSEEAVPDSGETDPGHSGEPDSTETGPDSSSGGENTETGPDSSSGDDSTGDPIQDLHNIGKAQQEVENGQRSPADLEAMKNQYRCNYVDASYCNG